MRVIELTQGMFAIVDDIDFDYLNTWKWYARKDRNKRNFYAERKTHGGGSIGMSRAIMCPEDNECVDHKNGNTLDNTRDNLRVCSNTENVRNARPILMYGNKKCTSSYKGVSWGCGKWRAIITVDGKRIHLGCFMDEGYASIVYREAAKKYFGEFAYQN